MKYTLLFLLFFSNSFAQKNVNKAQKLIYIAQYYNAKTQKNTALKYYEQAFELNPFAFKEYILPFSKLCNETKNLQLIEQTVEKTSHYYLYEADFFDGLNDYSIYDKIKNQLNKYQKNYYSNEENYKKIEFEKKLIELNFADQYLRILKEDYKAEFSFDIVEREDSIVIKKLIELTKTYGWSENANNILWHHRTLGNEQDAIWDYFTPFLNEQISKDLLKKDFFLKYELAKLYIYRNTAFKYQYIPDLERFYTKEVVASIDENRKKVGLPPLYFGQLLYPDDTMPPGYKYNPQNLLKDLQNL